jgi:hypothetical protein
MEISPIDIRGGISVFFLWIAFHNRVASLSTAPIYEFTFDKVKKTNKQVQRT